MQACIHHSKHKQRNRALGALRQLVVALAEPVQAEREADAFFRRLKNDESGGLGAAELAEQLVFEDDLGDAAVGEAADEAGAADVLVVELESEPGGQQDPERGDHAHQAALLVGSLEHDHGQAGIGAVFRHHALDQGALLGLGARRGVAADLPVAMDGAYRALRMGKARKRQKDDRSHESGQRRKAVRRPCHRSRKPHRVGPSARLGHSHLGGLIRE